MKKQVSALRNGIVLLILSLVFSVCGVGCTNPAAPENKPDGVAFLPVLNLSSSVQRNARSIQVVWGSTEFEAKLRFPLFMGTKPNTKGLKSGDSFTDKSLDNTVTTTISVENDATVFRGVFKDGLSGYELKVFSNNTFDFRQTIHMIADFMNEHGQPMKAEHIVMTTITGGTLTSDGYVAVAQNMVINTPKAGENTNGIFAVSFNLIAKQSKFLGLCYERGGGDIPKIPGDFSITNKQITGYPAPQKTAELAESFIYYRNGAWNFVNHEGVATETGFSNAAEVMADVKRDFSYATYFPKK